MSQLPSTPTSLASPTPLNTLLYLQQDGLVSPIKEDISTIFVVGFPEDMQEREFQNMFMFSPGFEAATLKIPNGTKDEEDMLMNNNNGRKQIIGFAKFRTRKEAMDARDILNGRKVDSEKGSLLKAEMAKKNLHTKRGLLNEQQQQQQQQQRTTGTTAITTTAYEAFYSVPHSLQSPNEREYSDFYSEPESAFISRSQSVDARSPPLTRFHISNFHQVDYLSKSTPPETPFMNFNHNSIHHQIASHPMNSPPSTTTSTGLSRVMEELFIHQHQPSISTPISSSPLSPTTSYRSLGGMLVGSSNPADQNPPCNTLYVGNLPPNTNEDELKSMFNKCPGYKRLSFRNKSNGPMCFVEFEDAIYAAQALQDLHGNPLSNSIKGGIRLSFSKNPLGVRQNTPATYPMVFNNRRESITTSNFDPQLS
ncbi:hypothetical protein EDC94DRAFT_552801 [Helicostylum pulchrum]|uniref:RRM domain-containing protein n=1 Tax=Helicostylum pulchrum TaxID=562976 RepID=A0ABP9XKK2_9FUNG|nr:hypothetical protein EDC94DRAFT_552801 [Helicostylum pulchrum]